MGAYRVLHDTHNWAKAHKGLRVKSGDSRINDRKQKPKLNETSDNSCGSNKQARP